MNFVNCTVISGGYTLIHKDYRGMGFLAGVFRQSNQMNRQFGFSSVLGRIAITARASLPTLREGGQLLGIIPKSVRISKFGWVSDIISYTDSTPRANRKHIDLVRFLFCITVADLRGARGTPLGGPNSFNFLKNFWGKIIFGAP